LVTRRLPKRSPCRAALLTAVGLSLVAFEVVFAQAAQVTTDVGPHYVGEAVSIRVTAVGFEEDPPPVVEAPPASSGSIQLVGVSPSVSQSITIVNGQMTRTREVSHVFQFRFVANRAGNLRLGPFRIKQGTRSATVAAVRLRVQDIPSNDDVGIELSLPPGPVFVGERVPVTVRFHIERSLQKNVLDYGLNVPLFDEQSAFRFLDEQTAGDTKVVIQSGADRLELLGTSHDSVRGRKHFTTVEVTRTLVPLVQGVHEIPGASISVQEGVRFRRDFFGGRRATEVRRWRAQTPGRSLVVAAIPGQEQPASFGGAIGRGFTLEVSADRTVVQVGDPITLTLVIHGEGVETASLPPLDAEGLMEAARFRVPEDPPTGELVGGGKRFTAIVRVLSDDVREVPALAYSWFDPDAKRFETTHSRPVALSVRSAEVIGAGDVEVAGAARESLPGSEDAPGSGRSPGESPRARSLALTGADLAIERDPARVLGHAGAWGPSWMSPALYAGSVLLVVLALFDRRRRDVDPGETRLRRVLAEELARIRGAGALPPGDGARQIALSLRQMQSEAPEAANVDLDEVLGECDARSYAPPGREQPLPSELLERAVRVAEAILERPK
jgi:hypothetical protein